MHLGEHRLQCRLDRVEAFDEDEDPEQHAARGPVLSPRLGPRERSLEQWRDLTRRPARERHRRATPDLTPPLPPRQGTGSESRERPRDP